MSISALIISLATAVSDRVAANRMGKAREAGMIRETEMLLIQLARPRITSERVARMHRMEALAARALGDARKMRARGAHSLADFCRRHAAGAIADAYAL